MSDLIDRQAAIDVLEAKKDKSAKGDIGGFYNIIIQNNIDEIETLPSAQPEPCEDAVSRRKAFEYFVSLWECIGTIMDREEWEDVCKTTANELPSVTPKRKTGKAVVKSDGKRGFWVCNQCGEDVHTWDKYCSECGAKLKGNE